MDSDELVEDDLERRSTHTRSDDGDGNAAVVGETGDSAEATVGAISSDLSEELVGDLGNTLRVTDNDALVSELVVVDAQVVNTAFDNREGGHGDVEIFLLLSLIGTFAFAFFAAHVSSGWFQETVTK